ncbi:MAG TPA: CHAT domain-containing protein [Blastocatellia bacterium]|nr:CHAT domain-containing protein [Blastocatellia bacterium]
MAKTNEVSSNLADNLLSAASAEAFFREQGGRIGWRAMAALKGEVDRLVSSDLNAANRLADRIEQVAALADEPLCRAFADAARARALEQAGHHALACAFYANAVSSLRGAGLRAEAAAIEKQQVTSLIRLGQFNDALKAARSARRGLNGTDPIQLAQLEANIGNIYYQTDRYRKALEYYDRARETFAAAGEEVMRATVEINRANVFTELDRPDEALAVCADAARTLEDAGRHIAAAHARYQIAYIHFQQGKYNTALTEYYRALARMTELGSGQFVAFCNHEIAEILLALNAFDDALESAAAARAGFTELGIAYDSARAAMTGALAAMGLQQFEQARELLSEARARFAADGNTTFTALADTYLAELALRRGDAAEAAQRAAAALRVFARQQLRGRAETARLLAARAAYQAGDLKKAARHARAVLGAVTTPLAAGLLWQCHHLLGRIARDRGKSEDARASFLAAVETVERMRGGIAADEFKASFLRDKIEAYEDAIAACLDEGSREMTERAFRLVESSKSRALADLLARYVRDTASETPASETRAQLLRRIEELNWYNSHAGLEDDKGDQRKAKLAERYRREASRCERQIAQLFRRLEAEGSAFAEIQRMASAEVSDLQAALAPDETAVEYFTTGDQVSAFIVTRRGMKVARQVASRREVERLLAALRFQIEKFNYGADYVDAYFGQLKRAVDGYLARLHQAVFAPVERLLAGDRLIVIPHGALHYVPFHALRAAQDYLIDRFEVSYAPSAAVLRLCRGRNLKSQISDLKSQTYEMVALGVVHRETPSIADELAAIGAIFPDATVLTGDAATRDNLLRLAPGARFLHLASHGYFRRDNPMFSFLKLADAALNFYSLLELKLRAEMVTLSACHTGVNMVFPGDELHGLMRGFLYAGAPSLVASLWAVSDRSTADFMREMYGQIQSGASKRAALRAAALRVKENYGHPYYWAPFVLMGNPA